MTDILKRGLALLLCVLMLTALSVAALATGEVQPETAQEEILPEEDADLPEEEALSQDEPEGEEAVFSDVDEEGEDRSDLQQDANEPEQQEPVEEVVILDETEVESASAPADNEDDRLYDYMVQTALDNMSTVARSRAYYSAADHLNDNTRTVYNAMLPTLKDIAAGKESSTELEFDTQVLGFYHQWTAEELGVEWILYTADNGKRVWNPDAKTAAWQKTSVDLSLLQRALLSDCPYETYWFDKTTGMRMLHSFAAPSTGEYICVTAITIEMPVSEDYWLNPVDGRSLEVNTELASAATAAAANAAEVADSFASCSSTLDRMTCYRDWICDAVDYNHSAADNSATPYGNPWQLIWVFDKDPTTKVVCEGYSKAFKYLCDLSGFSGIECRLVSGDTNFGAHMWNVVQMPDGKNYLVDVTNYDTATSSSIKEALFLGGHHGGSVDSGYRILSNTYPYDEATRSTFTDAELTLSDTAYSEFIPTASLTDCTITVSDVIYNGLPQTPELTVQLGSVTLVQGQDYDLSDLQNNIEVGEASFTITGKGSYTGTKYGTFRIKPISLGDAVITAAAETYTGRALKPVPQSVTLGNKTLVKGTDYTILSYSNNTELGTATITIQGIGTYTGQATGKFQIKTGNTLAIKSAPANLVKGKSVSLNVTGNGAITLKSSNTKVATVSGKTVKGVSAGTVTITITAAGDATHFAGTQTLKLTIYPSCTTPAAPTLQNAPTGLKISWSKSTGAAKYRVFYKYGTKGWTKLVDTTSTAYTWTKAVSGTKYTFTIRCISADGKTYTSDYNKTGKTIYYVAAPTLTNSAAKTMKVSWKKITGVTGYQVSYATASSFKGAKTVNVKGAGSLSTLIKSLKKGTTYYVRIRTYTTKSGKTTYSVWSGVKSIKLTK